jgi:hypothetical protein
MIVSTGNISSKNVQIPIFNLKEYENVFWMFFVLFQSNIIFKTFFKNPGLVGRLWAEEKVITDLLLPTFLSVFLCRWRRGQIS